MTAEHLAEIRARCYAATRGPWDSIRTRDLPEEGATPVSKCHGLEFGWSRLLTIVAIESTVPGVPVRSEPRFKRVEDSDFVALARADVPALLDEVERLRSILESPEQALFADDRAPTTNERHLLNLLTWRQKESEAMRQEIARLERIVQGLADRVAAQSDLLSKRAEGA